MGKYNPQVFDWEFNNATPPLSDGHWFSLLIRAVCHALYYWPITLEADCNLISECL